MAASEAGPVYETHVSVILTGSDCRLLPQFPLVPYTSVCMSLAAPVAQGFADDSTVGVMEMQLDSLDSYTDCPQEADSSLKKKPLT